MSFFPRGYISDPTTSFHPLFRLLDDFDTYRAIDRPSASVMKSFTPKFDLKEVKDGYELHGELPGIEQKDIEIEFTDANTLTIKGRTERSYESGTRPAAIAAPAEQGRITEEGHNGHKATVEDEDAAAKAEVVKVSSITPF